MAARRFTTGPCARTANVSIKYWAGATASLYASITHTKNMVRTLGVPGEIIEVVDSIMVKGRTYARHNYYWENVVNNPEARVVEGVGRNDTGLMCGTAGLVLAYLMDYMEFEACYENGEYIFSNRDFYVPSVTDGIKTAPTSHLTPSPLYDLQGRRVSGEPRRGGVYISGGRKIVK